MDVTDGSRAFAAVVGMTLASDAALAKQSDQPIDIGTFSGAFLAARVAEVDNDVPGAIAYYQRALTFDPDDTSLQQSLLLALISNGDFDKGAAVGRQAEDGAGRRALLAADAGRRCVPQEGLSPAPKTG